MEVGKEVGFEASLEWEEAVVLCVSSAISPAASESRVVVCMGLRVAVAVGTRLGLELGVGLASGLECKLDGGGENEDTEKLGVEANTGAVALVVANLAAIGGKGAWGADIELVGPEPEPEEPGGDTGPEPEVDVDNENELMGIGGTAGVGFDFRLKNDGDFFGFAESEPLSSFDFDDALDFLEEMEASERYAPSLPASVSYSVASPPSGNFNLPLSFFSFLLLLFFIFSSFLASFAAAFASFSASFAALASISFLAFSFSFLLFGPTLTYPSLS